MKKLKMKRKISAIFIFAIILLIIIGIIAWGIITLITEATTFLNNFNIYFDKVSNFSQNIISNFNYEKIQISDEVKEIANNASTQVIRNCIKLA
jgi:predicted PurR-regulated permease PerM